jgi:NAD(P)H-dependent nitrite reductase small subunit
MAVQVKLLGTNDLPLGESRCIKIEGKELALFHTEDGFFVLDNTCPHKGGPLFEGTVSEGKVTCPWHQWHFDLKSGGCVNIPGRRVTVYPLEIKKNELWITL